MLKLSVLTRRAIPNLGQASLQCESVSYRLMSLPLQNLSRRFVTASPHNATTGMCRGAAKIKTFDWRTIICITRERSHKKEAGEGHRSLHDVAAGKPEHRFQVRGGQYLITDYRFAELGR